MANKKWDNPKYGQKDATDRVPERHIESVMVEKSTPLVEGEPDYEEVYMPGMPLPSKAQQACDHNGLDANIDLTAPLTQHEQEISDFVIALSAFTAGFLIGVSTILFFPT